MDDILKKNLIKELGLDKLPGERQEEIFAQIGRLVLEGILTRAIPMLSNSEKEEFEHIIEESGNGEGNGKVYSFLKAALPNFEQIVNEEIAEFKQDSFDVMSKIG